MKIIGFSNKDKILEKLKENKIRKSEVRKVITGDNCLDVFFQDGRKMLRINNNNNENNKRAN